MTEAEQLLQAFDEMRKGFSELTAQMKEKEKEPDKKTTYADIAIKFVYFVVIPLLVTVSTNNVSNANRDNKIAAIEKGLTKNEEALQRKIEVSEFEKQWRNHIEKNNYNFQYLQQQHPGMYLLIEKNE